MYRPRLASHAFPRSVHSVVQSRIREMVRPEETDKRAREGWSVSTSCATPAGESQTPVNTGAPGSSPHPGGRDSDARAGREEPMRRREPCSEEQAQGPQHERSLQPRQIHNPGSEQLPIACERLANANSTALN